MEIKDPRTEFHPIFAGHNFTVYIAGLVVFSNTESNWESCFLGGLSSHKLTAQLFDFSNESLPVPIDIAIDSSKTIEILAEGTSNDLPEFESADIQRNVFHMGDF